MKKKLLLYYPVIKTHEEFNDFYGRYLWYLSKYKNIEVIVYYKNSLLKLRSVKYPQYFMKLDGLEAKNIKIKKYFNNFSKYRLIKDLIYCDFIIIHKDIPLPIPKQGFYEPGNGSAPPKFENNIIKKDRFFIETLVKKRNIQQVITVWIIDKNSRDRMEAIFAASLPYFLDQRVKPKAIEKMRGSSQKKLRKLKANLSNYKKCYIFGTGPTLNRAFEFNYFDGIRIICNSIVKDKRLLEHIKPHIILAADAVFHFGVSKYCETYRNDLYEALVKYDAIFILPERYASLLILNIPKFEKYIISMPIEKREYNYDLANFFYLKALENILNLFYLPLASFFADEIYAIGFYGRRKHDKFFWKHNVDAQYNEFMKFARQAHPSFFKYQNYNQYNDLVNDMAEMAMTIGEGKGKKYYSLTETLFPAFNKRQQSPTK